jgi:hypothetical protein
MEALFALIAGVLLGFIWGFVTAVKASFRIDRALEIDRQKALNEIFDRFAKKNSTKTEPEKKEAV